MLGSFENYCEADAMCLLGSVQEFMPSELFDQSTYGHESLLKTEEIYNQKADKKWDEGKLEDWEFKRNGSKDWEGRVARS